ncbi:MAG: division/cell wall cluster transcriptional repressor MraZ [Treponema sp.]|jgi:MraZ protein|nr:division/cell wall cluster transcriptional repressor MraZ [Treponema sp.]
MNLLTGEYSNTLDEKGRVSLPSHLREELPGNTLVMTKGIENCLWLFSPEQWEKTAGNLMNQATLSLEKLSLVQHRFIAPAKMVEIDKIGRIAVPQRLRDFAGLNKDCIIMGMGKFIEIWDIERYDAYCEGNMSKLKAIVEEMGPASVLF